MSQETLLTEHIFNISVIPIIFMDDVTGMFNKYDQCRATNHWNAILTMSK